MFDDFKELLSVFNAHSVKRENFSIEIPLGSHEFAPRA
jgi:hypothetical protein